MPILNMITQGSGGGWWGNIWEPLNLTVTTSWLDATITWEDNEIWTIPPTTFQKSELVRKIGSAPTYPSDWTLVVTETVKDTYKVSGYVDSWLTDWTTYYYRVFSYSDLGGISYCDAVSVTPSAWWWTPWANTLARWKLDGDTTDELWNYDMTTRMWTVTYWTLPSWDSYGIFDWNTIITNASVPSWTKWTLSMWVYKTTNSFSSPFVQDTDSNDSDYYVQIGLDTAYIQFWASMGQANLTWNYTQPIWEWHHIVMTQDWTYLNVYVDWQQLPSTVTNSKWFNTNWWNQLCIWWLARWTQSYSKLDWWLSNVIIESEAWTAQEISDYFNLTKWDYWIS